MKRLQILLAPLFAIPFFTGCSLQNAHALIFDLTNCSMEDEKGEIHTGLYTILNSKEITVTGKLIPESGYKFINDSDSVQFVNNDTKEPITEGCSYTIDGDGTADFSVKMTTDIRVITNPKALSY